MSIPQGNIWQALRSSALDAIPEGSRAVPGLPVTFRQWLRSGAFSVTAASSKNLTLNVVSQDIGAFLFAEAGMLLDQAQEHAIQMRLQLASGRWVSPAWSSVALYYWAYYLVLAITRLMGTTPYFISDEEAKLLKGIGPGGMPFGAGPRILKCGAANSATMRSIELRRSSQTRLHDVVWQQWFSMIRTLTKAQVQAHSTSPELLAYLPQVRAANALGDSWPSDYRNAVNYVPGLAYGAVRGRTPTAVFAQIDPDAPKSFPQTIEQFDADSGAITSRSDVREQLPAATRLLISLTFTLDAIAHALFKDILERRGMDRRWIRGREVLCAAQYGAFASVDWPVTSAA